VRCGDGGADSIFELAGRFWLLEETTVSEGCDFIAVFLPVFASRFGQPYDAAMDGLNSLSCALALQVHTPSPCPSLLFDFFSNSDMVKTIA
jgi:hypothetical protein